MFRSKKNKGKLRMQELFSNEFLQASLEKLDWQYAESKGHAFENFQIKKIEDESIFFAIMLRSLAGPLTLGDYVYRRMGSDRLERESPKIKPKTTYFKKFKLSAPYTIRIRKQQEKKERVVRVT